MTHLTKLWKATIWCGQEQICYDRFKIMLIYMARSAIVCTLLQQTTYYSVYSFFRSYTIRSVIVYSFKRHVIKRFNAAQTRKTNTYFSVLLKCEEENSLLRAKYPPIHRLSKTERNNTRQWIKEYIYIYDLNHE